MRDTAANILSKIYALVFLLLIMEQKRPIIIGNVAGAMEDCPDAMLVFIPYYPRMRNR